jgi:hypothetical protein
MELFDICLVLKMVERRFFVVGQHVSEEKIIEINNKMMNTSRDLPIGIQDFEDLRTGGYVYVDKTKYVYQLVTTGKPYFLGRPRRFGKSLLLSTLKAYFLGKKELFNGLAIAELEKNWIEYPVFHIDMGASIITDTDLLYRRLDVILTELENRWGKNAIEKDPASRFIGLIQRASEKSGKKVVVLIDDSDKPLLDSINDFVACKKIHRTLDGFYGILKSADAYLRFVFFTGIVRFPQDNLMFSGLNQLINISRYEHYADICGISEPELLRDFEPELYALAEHSNITYDEAFAEIKKHYGGYHFAKKSEEIYNPFSVLNAFAHKNFASYWFKENIPTFQLDMLKKYDIDISKINVDIFVSADDIGIYRLENNRPMSILYLFGYLTTKSYDAMFNEYVLDFPNEEVKSGFLQLAGS